MQKKWNIATSENAKIKKNNKKQKQPFWEKKKA